MGDISESDPIDNYFESNLAAAQEMLTILLSINGPNLSASRIGLYNLRGDYLSFGKIPESRQQINQFLLSDQLRIQYVKLDELRGKKLIIPPHSDTWSDDQNYRIISLIRMIKSSSLQNYAIAQVQQPYEMLADLLEVNDLKVILFSEAGEVMASSARTNKEVPIDEMKIYYHRAAQISDNEQIVTDMESGTQEVIVAVRSEFTNQLLVMVQSRDELFVTKRTALEILFFSGFSLVIMTLIITFFISQRLTKPLVQLRKSMKNVTLSNLSIDLDQTGSANEFTLLYRAFDAMFRRLNESMSQEIKAHLLALQSQMNPHFLYNMLAVISSTAEESGNDNVVNMCHKLSRMLRYVSSFDESEATITSELDHTINYLSLMKERYEDYFSFTIDVDHEEASTVKIPKLIMQPIVENSFHHGFQEITPPWFIHIKVEVSDLMWKLEVSDNGIGINDDAIQRLQQKIRDTMLHSSIQVDGLKIGGLGLVNTIVRLKLLYKEKFEYQIESSQPQGAKITLRGMI
ncbi:hypothetical protein SD71_00260 [Cohnella kolymensis]|uniref:HAMP domain-containing protein n=1 Tax=Cohnella kolymensis TaxID=1590652 RepID=A0ABR5A836_9BACL|nr:histidine kinase [Cohnella kolymensis]KIL37211.1 hypothetical protein SD71_00260 [Cohnella kolymensis]